MRMFSHVRELVVSLAVLTGSAREAPRPLEEHCADHPGQVAFMQDERRVRKLLTSRRWGKSEVLVVELARPVLYVPGAWAVYITKTRKNARALAWKTLKRVLDDAGHRYKANESDLILEVEGGGSILMGGADKITEIEKYRGFPFAIAIVDECGVYPSDLLRALIDDVLEPATVDYDGRMVFAGTPGPTLEGVWYQMTGPQAEGVHRGTLRDNPYLRADVERFLAELRESKGWSEDHPTYVREYLGLWVQDDSVLVFPFSVERNGYEPSASGPHGLPTHTTTGHRLTLRDWVVVVALDAGYVDANGYAVVATHPNVRESYIIATHKRRKQLIEQAAREIRTLLERYSIEGQEPRLIVDAGGMGKIHAATFGRKYGLAVIPADKRDKPSSISLTRDDTLSGRLKVFAGEQNDAVRGEFAVLGWDKKREGIADGQEDHATDAALYALRDLRNFTQAPPPSEPEKGTGAWWKKQERLMEESLEKGARKRKRGRRAA